MTEDAKGCADTGAESRSRWPQPGELWSLWDMLELIAKDFMRVLGDVKVLESKLRDYAFTYRYDDSLDSVSFPDHYLGQVLNLRDYADRIGLTLTAKSLNIFLSMFSDGSYQYEQEGNVRVARTVAETCYSMLSDSIRRLSDEAESITFLVIEPTRHRIYQQNEPIFGALVAQQFPSLIDEISEAGKCYALGLSTACAFHSIRAMEAGIRAISRCLSIPDPTKGSDRSWANILRSIDAEAKKRWPTSADKMTGDGRIIEELYGALAGMQNPYRNSTAHLDASYNDDQARHILELAKGFLVRVSERMDEQGLPKA